MGNMLMGIKNEWVVRNFQLGVKCGDWTVGMGDNTETAAWLAIVGRWDERQSEPCLGRLPKAVRYASKSVGRVLSGLCGDVCDMMHAVGMHAMIRAGVAAVAPVAPVAPVAGAPSATLAQAPRQSRQSTLHPTASTSALDISCTLAARRTSFHVE